LKIPHLDAVSMNRERDVAFHAVKGIEKHQNQYGKKNGKHHEYEQYGQKQKQRGFPGQQAQLSASKLSKTAEELPFRVVDDRETIDDALINDPARCKTPPSQGGSKRNSKKVSSTNITCKLSLPLTDRQSRKSKNSEQPNADQLLLPQGETGKSNTGAGGRKKDPRLVGADLYVTRLGWNKSQVVQEKTKKSRAKAAPVDPPETVSETTSETESDNPPSLSSSTSSIFTQGTTGSLHDELRNRLPRTPPPAATREPTTQSIPREAIHDSRPCYRCISYMHAVGIKRVFWTNDAGEWEGGKVANLVNALDGGADGSGSGGGPMGNGVFVTKHEVLNMRRTMGGG
jgi:hypothetical protein